MTEFEIEKMNLVIQIIENNDFLTYNTKENLFNNYMSVDTIKLNQLNHLCNTYKLLTNSENEFLKNKAQVLSNQIETLVSQF